MPADFQNKPAPANRLRLHCPHCRKLVTLPAVVCPACGANMRTGFGGREETRLDPLKLVKFGARMLLFLVLGVFLGREAFFGFRGEYERMVFPKIREQVAAFLADGPGATAAVEPPAKGRQVLSLAQRYPHLFRPDILMGRISDEKFKGFWQDVIDRQKFLDDESLASCLLPGGKLLAASGRPSVCQQALKYDRRVLRAEESR